MWQKVRVRRAEKGVGGDEGGFLTCSDVKHSGCALTSISQGRRPHEDGAETGTTPPQAKECPDPPGPRRDPDASLEPSEGAWPS